MARNGCRSTDRNHGVTKAWLPQKARFYAGLRAVLWAGNQVTIQNMHPYIQKYIFALLYIKVPRA